MYLLPSSSGLIALMVKAGNIAEMLVDFYWTSWHNNPEDSHLQTCCHENLKPHMENLD
jgi:hypothetical protein